MCDIYKYDDDNYQVDGDMYIAEELAEINTWHQVGALLGREKANQMQEFGFKPSEIVQFMNRVSHAA